jgi:hypothetical protein
VVLAMATATSKAKTEHPPRNGGEREPGGEPAMKCYCGAYAGPGRAYCRAHRCKTGFCRKGLMHRGRHTVVVPNVERKAWVER